MKIIKLILIISAITLTLANTNENQNNNNKFLENTGEASNTSKESTMAVNYSLAKAAKTSDVYVTNEKDFKTPSFVDKLPMRQPIDTGNPEVIDEVPSLENYYDGSIGLKTSATFCQKFIDKAQACMHQGNCGWCLSSNKCIPGTKAGPLEDCLRGNYLFTAPNADWNPVSNPNVKVQRQQVVGAQLTTITQQPDKQ